MLINSGEQLFYVTRDTCLQILTEDKRRWIESEKSITILLSSIIQRDTRIHIMTHLDR